jgi:hypothetical protein
MKRAIRTATIQHSMDFGNNAERNPARRVTLNLRKDGDAYRWYGVEDGEEFDTEVSAATVAEAEEAALEAWAGWGLKATWGSTELR